MSARKLVYTALFAALTAAGAFLRIPLGVSSITLQFLFTAMAGVLLGAGGGALAAAALDADVYENWTDVSGILMADPRIVENPAPIRRVTYSELRELSYLGAQVLHEGTVFPVREKNIPLNIRNTNDPAHDGTMILSSIDDETQDDSFITGIAGKKGFSIITVAKSGMSSEPGAPVTRRSADAAAADAIAVSGSNPSGDATGCHSMDR